MKGKPTKCSRWVTSSSCSSSSEDSYPVIPRMDRYRAPGQGTHRDVEEDALEDVSKLFATPKTTSPDQDEEKPLEMSEFARALSGLSDFFSVTETVEDINEAFARIIDASLRRKPSEEAIKELVKKHPRPGNVPNLQVPKTNGEVWEQ